MSLSITLSRSFSSSDSFLAAQRELYREYRRTHKLDKAAEAKYVANVKKAAAYIDATRNSFWVFGKVAPTSESYVSFVVLRKIKNQIKRWIIAVKINRVASVAIDDPTFSPLRFTPPEIAELEAEALQADDDDDYEPKGICPVCGKLVYFRWHKCADEADQLDETGE